MKIGNAIKLIRQERGLTQAELAEMVGTSEAAISRYESCNRVPNLNTFFKLASSLGVTPKELYEGEIDIHAETTAQKIRSLRIRGNMTQADLANKLGISAALVQQYESGNRNPKLETLQALAKGLGVSIVVLLPDWLLAEIKEVTNA